MFSSSLGAVADGMGGHLGGEQAASIVIADLSEVDGAVSREALVALVKEANRNVYRAAEKPELRGMGTTIVAATLHPEEQSVTVVNVGDSRCYRLREGSFEQITVDHSLVEELVRQGRISPDDALSHPQRNIVTRAIGLADSIDVDVFELDAEHGDRFVLCSDGLFNEVDVEQIAMTLSGSDGPRDVAEELVAMAVAEGGRDNVSVVVIDLIDDDASPPERTQEISVVPIEIDESGDPLAGFKALGRADPKKRGLRRRTGAFLLAIVATVAVALLAVNWFARNAYFATDDGGEVVIFRGRPGGVLWVDPEEARITGVAIDDLTPGAVQKLEQEVEWSSLDDAEQFVANLERAEPSTTPDGS